MPNSFTTASDGTNLRVTNIKDFSGNGYDSPAPSTVAQRPYAGVSTINGYDAPNWFGSNPAAAIHMEMNAGVRTI